jgi:hypothetical protein
MSLQPSDPAADAFERLRSEIALLRRAVEGLAADTGLEPIDYSPTLAELAKTLAEVNVEVTALGERPLLALAPEQLGALLHQAVGRMLAKPVAELERERVVLGQATEALRAARQADAARSRIWRRTASLVGVGAVAGAVLWGLLLGPFARMLPAAWGAPERLAAATLALPMAPAGERLLRRGDPGAWDAVQLVRRLADSQLADLQRCLARSGDAKARTCTLKTSRGLVGGNCADRRRRTRASGRPMVAFV